MPSFFSPFIHLFSTLFVIIVLMDFSHNFEDPIPYDFTSSCQILSKSVPKFLSYLDFSPFFHCCDLDHWRLSVIIKLIRAPIFLHHPTKWRQNRSITFWDILFTRSATDRQTDKRTDKPKWSQCRLSLCDGGKKRKRVRAWTLMMSLNSLQNSRSLIEM